MIVKRIVYLTDESPCEILTECDSVRIHRDTDSFNLKMFRGRDEDLVGDFTFTKKTRVFIMENGKTVDRVDFNPQTGATGKYPTIVINGRKVVIEAEVITYEAVMIACGSPEKAVKTVTWRNQLSSGILAPTERVPNSEGLIITAIGTNNA